MEKGIGFLLSVYLCKRQCGFDGLNILFFKKGGNRQVERKGARDKGK